jgi:hypothetical protein
MAGVALGDACRLRAQEGSPFTLKFPEIDISVDGTGDLAVSVVASAPCTLDLKLIGAAGPILEQPQWKLEARHAESAVDKTLNVFKGGRATVSASIRPRSSTRPEIAGVVQPAHIIDLAELERSAERVAFDKDPDRRPQPGHFLVTLATDSRLLLRIWESPRKLGLTIYERRFGHLPQGINPIVWDLRTNEGSIALPGQYVATLAATPINGSSTTLFFSSFQLL